MLTETTQIPSQIEYKFEPSNPLQEKQIWTLARESVFDGGIANGKTSGALIRLLILASRYRGSRWVVFRQTYLDLCKTTRTTFNDKVCPAQWIKRDVKEMTTLHNDAEILWLHLDEMSEASLRGLEINGACGDQVEEISPEMWEILDSRIGRWQRPEWPTKCPPYIWGTSNPEGHDWVYYRFHPDIVKYDETKNFSEWDRKQIAIAKRKGIVPSDFAGFPLPSLTAENKDKCYIFGNTMANLAMLEKVNPGYVKNLARKPESWKRKWLYGSRDIFEGMVHSEWRRNVHTYDPGKFDLFKQRKIRTIRAFFDYGLSAPTCLLLVATDDEKIHWVFREYYAANRKISEHAESIKKVIAEAEKQAGQRLEAVYADPSIFNTTTRDRHGMTASVADEYSSCGIWMVKADNKEESSIERINELLKVRSSQPNPITHENGCPGIFISADCSELIEQIPQQRWKEARNALTGEKEFVEERSPDIPDHSYDCLRYFANSQADYVPWTGEIKIPQYGAHRA